MSPGNSRLTVPGATETNRKNMTRAELLALLAHADKGTWKLDTITGRVEYSPAAVALHGPAFAGAEQSGGTMLAALSPQDREVVLAALVTATTAGFSWFEYTWFVGGAERRIRAFAVAERDSGLLTGLVEDVTDRMVAERVLLVARQTADAASHTKSRFLANMSHEIRTPMNAILGMTRLVLDTSLGTEQREYLEAVETSGEALLSLINDILDLSKIEAGKLELDDGPLRPADIIEEIARSLAVRAHEKGVEVIVDIEPSAAVELEGDARRFRQVITNVLGNAVKFTYAGEVVVRVRRADDMLVVRVEDTGVGIAESHLSAIFDPFRQVDAETTRDFGGTGLGLSISRELVTLMHGSMSVESVEGEGSQFEIRIPAARALLVAAAPTSFSSRRRVGILARTKDFAAVLVRQLSEVDAQIEVFDDAADLFRAVATTSEGASFDLVVDQDLLGPLPGIDLVRRLKGLPGIASVALMARLSARFSAEQLDDAGVDALLRKPLRSGALAMSLIAMATPPAEEPPREVIVRPAITITARDPATRAKHSERPPEPTACAEQRVLVVEDEALNARLVCAILRKLGYTPIHAQNGRKAVEMAALDEYALILMDIQMPVLDGLEATREIRKDQAHTGRRTPIVAFTANAMNGDRERCIGAGMEDYLSKPMSARELEAVLRKYAPTALNPAKEALVG